jgi:hypothetical protein
VLLLAAALLLDEALLPQPAMARHATTAGSAQRTRCWRLIGASLVRAFM